MVVIESVDLTSDTEDSFNETMEIDEFPFKCMKCPLKFRQMQDAQAHFLKAHQKIKKRVSFKDDYEEFVFEKEDFEEDFSEIEDSFGTEIDMAECNLESYDCSKGEESNYCSRCDRFFKSHLWLRHHLRKKHNENLVDIDDTDNFCQICSKQFKGKLSYRVHKKTFHEGDCQTCPRCKGKFEQKYLLKEHMKNNQNCRKDAKKEQKKRQKQIQRKDKLEILQFQKQSALPRKEPTIIKVTKDESSTSLPTMGLKIKDFARDILKEENISEQELWTTNTR